MAIDDAVDAVVMAMAEGVEIVRGLVAQLCHPE